MLILNGVDIFDILFDSWSAIDFTNIDILISATGIELVHVDTTAYRIHHQGNRKQKQK